MNAVEHTNTLIEPETLPANFDLEQLTKDPKELAKYAFPKDFHVAEGQGYTDKYYDNELVLETATPEEIGRAVLALITEFNKSRKDKVRRIRRIYLDVRTASPVNDTMKLKAIKGIIDNKKRALKQAEARKAETMRKAMAAAKTLQALGVTVTLPDALKTKAEKVPSKRKKTSIVQVDDI